MASTIRIALAASALSAAACVPAHAHIIPFFAMLDGGQVVDPTDSLATGVASIGYDHHGFTIEVKLYLEGISLKDLKGDGPNDTSIHINLAPVGENGPTVIDLAWWTPTTFEEYAPNRIFAHWQGVLIGGEQGNIDSNILTDEDALYDGLTYIDIHTNNYPGGEIRGQIYEVPAPGALGLLGVAGLVAVRRRR